MTDRSWAARLKSLAINFRRDEAGAVTIFVVMTIPLLVAVMAIVADIGFAYVRQRQMQVAADAAAYSAAGNIIYALTRGLTPTHYGLEARSVAATSGFVNGANNVTVTSVLGAPSSTTCVLPFDCVKVTISEQRHFVFLQAAQRLFNRADQSGNLTIGAAAVAAIRRDPNANYCMLALAAANQADAVKIGGSATITTPTNHPCGIADNSSSNAAFNTTGCGSSADIPINVVGGATANCSSSIVPQLGAYPTPDPYQANGARTALENYQPSSCASLASNAVTLSPGCYNDFKTNNNLTLLPGVYYLNKLDIGNITITGTGVTIIINPTQTSWQFNGNAVLNIKAPTSGAFQGIAITSMATRSSVSEFVYQGNLTAAFEGALYFPHTTIKTTGSLNGTCMQIVADVIDLTGATTLNQDCPMFTGNGAPRIQTWETGLIQ
jgi:hypothetical protein